MIELKPLNKESIPKALIRAKHYRMLNEPWQAESICRDILKVDSTNQKALLYLILVITDRFTADKASSYPEAKELCKEFISEYEQYYYRGIIEERFGKATLHRPSPRVKYIAYDHYKCAMYFFEKAEKIQPKDNQDAVLRWNACVRGIQEFRLEAAPEEDRVQSLLDV